MRVKILLLTLFIVFPLISFATDYYITTAELNVRTGAGTEYSVSFTLQKGDEVEILSQENSWYQIKFHGKIGYAHSKFLKYNRTSRTTSITNSNSPQKVIDKILIGLYFILALYIVYIIYDKLRNKKLLESVTEPSRGTKSERKLVLKLLKSGISEQTIFHDLYVEKYKGDFSQIDLVVLTEVGIIVFEVKDYSGWIFGSGDQPKWTQVLAYGKQKYRFYNPIMQNNRHIAELRKQLLKFGDIPFYSIVVFYGDSVLKEIDFVPNGTFIVKSERVV